MRDKIVHFLPLLLFLPFFVFITFFYYQRVGAFGCGDDCFNIVAGYFLNHGGNIYSGFFFDHAPLMAYLSAFIQSSLRPDNLYRLILYHRLSLYIFSFIFGIILTLKFRWSGFLFMLVFETIKFYFFGDRFLAESFIVYPIVYMLGVNLRRLEGRNVKLYDYLAVGVFTWFVAFSREPYGLLALFLLVCLIIKSDRRRITASLGIFIMFCLATLMSLPTRDFYTNVVVYNQDRGFSEILSRGGPAQNLFATVLYPIYSLLHGEKSLLRGVLMLLSIPFFYSLFRLIENKKYLTVLFVLLALGLSNIRFVSPGFMYFQAFHMTVWYGVLIFVISYFIFSFGKIGKTFSLTIVGTLLLLSLISPASFLRLNRDKLIEFNTSYAQEFLYGAAMKNLSNPTDTIFVDGRDELIYQIADRPSSYRYLWYTSFMPLIPLYSRERTQMLKNSQPDFYYDACAQVKRPNPDFIRVKLNTKPSCLMVKKSKIKQISKEQAESVESLGFSLN